MKYPPHKSPELPFLMPLRLKLKVCGLTGCVPVVVLELSPELPAIRMVPADSLPAIPSDLINLVRNSMIAGMSVFHLSAKQFASEPDFSLAVRSNPYLEKMLGLIAQNNGTVFWEINLHCGDPILFSRFDGSSMDKQPTALDRVGSLMRHIQVNLHLGKSIEDAEQYHWQPLKALKALVSVLQIPLSVYVSVPDLSFLPTLMKISDQTEAGMHFIVTDLEESLLEAGAALHIYQTCLSKGWRIDHRY